MAGAFSGRFALPATAARARSRSGSRRPPAAGDSAAAAGGEAAAPENSESGSEGVEHEFVGVKELYDTVLREEIDFQKTSTDRLFARLAEARVLYTGEAAAWEHARNLQDARFLADASQCGPSSQRADARRQCLRVWDTMQRVRSAVRAGAKGAADPERPLDLGTAAASAERLCQQGLSEAGLPSD